MQLLSGIHPPLTLTLIKLPLYLPNHLPLQLHLDILPILSLPLLPLLIAPVLWLDLRIRANDSIAYCLFVASELQFVLKRFIVLDEVVADVHATPIAQAISVVGRAGLRYGAKGAGVGVAYLVCQISRFIQRQTGVFIREDKGVSRSGCALNAAVRLQIEVLVVGGCDKTIDEYAWSCVLVAVFVTFMLMDTYIDYWLSQG
jgi:hypothetical protein